MSDGDRRFAALVATALKNDLGGTHKAAKMIMHWTGASERSAKNWLTGACGPSGRHLVQLAKHSDEVFNLVLLMADRQPIATTLPLVHLRTKLAQALEAIDRQLA